MTEKERQTHFDYYMNSDLVEHAVSFRYDSDGKCVSCGYQRNDIPRPNVKVKRSWWQRISDTFHGK